MFKKIKGFISEWGGLAFEFSFMLCIFAPLDLYFSNKDEYWFTITQLLSVAFLISIAFLIVLLICFFGFSKMKKSEYIYAFFTCILIYFYIQGNYIPRNYGVLNGEEIDWSSYTSYEIASIALAIACIIIGVVLCVKFRDKITLFGTGVSVFLFLIQFVTILTLSVQNIDNTKSAAKYVNTEKNILELSEDKNVVVFLLDTFDGSYMNELISSDNKKCSEVFEDFTFYKDTLGAYPTTKCALPHILTGKWYENEEPFADYVKKAYIDNKVYINFAEKDYKLDVYTDSMFLAPDIVTFENVEEGNYYISDNVKFAKEIYTLVSFNYMPQQLKRFFFTDTDAISNLKESTTTSSSFSSDTIRFVNKLEKEGLNVSRKGNLFKFYHLDGTHQPYTFGEDLTSDANVNYTYLDETLGNIELVRKYIDQLKEKNLYDNTAIVILADHGQLGYSQNPLFMIKNFGEKHEFAVSDIKMTFDQLDEIWIALANNEIVDESFISNYSSEYQNRRFLYYNWDDAWSRMFMPGMEEMYSFGPAYDHEQLIASGRVYLSENADYSYQLGTPLDFISGRTGYNYCPYGISYGNVKKKALLKFDLKNEKYDNVKVSLQFSDKCYDGVVAIYANDNLVAETTYEKNRSFDFIVPKEYIADNILELIFDQTHGIDDSKNSFTATNMEIDKIVLENTAEEFILENQCTIMAFSYELGKTIQFNRDDSSASVNILSGFSKAEPKGCWTNSTEAVLKFMFNEQYSKDVEVTLDYHTFNGEQNVSIFANDIEVESYVADGHETKVFSIPAEYIREGLLDLKFALPDAKSPNDLGMSEDGRDLALFFYSLTITEK